MSWSTLNTNLYNLLNDNKTALGLQEMYSYPELAFVGYPAAHMNPSEQENDYETTSENMRTYAFKLRLFETIKDQGIDAALTTLRTVADNVIDKIDQENELNSGMTINANLPARYTFINIVATPSNWGQTDDEQLVFNELTVRIKVSVDVT